MSLVHSDSRCDPAAVTDLLSVRAVRLIERELQMMKAVETCPHDTGSIIRVAEELLRVEQELEADWGRLLLVVAPGREVGVTITERLEEFLHRLGSAGNDLRQPLTVKRLMRYRRIGLRDRRDAARREAKTRDAA
jgi:hypothetical protein